MSNILAAIPFWAWALLVPVGLVSAFLVLLFVVALVEKIPVSAFGGKELPVDPGQLPPYLNAINEAAAQNGFTYGGTFGHVKGGTYQVFATFWFSADRRAILKVTGGTIVKVQHRASLMTSATADGRFLETRDELKISDLSDTTNVQVVVYADFDELCAAHASRLQPLGNSVRTFEQSSARQADFEIDFRRATVMVERGMARWTDASRSAFRYTLRGALRITTTQFFGQFVKHHSQRERFSRPRPGDRLSQSGFPVQTATALPHRPPSRVRPPGGSERDFLH